MNQHRKLLQTIRLDASDTFVYDSAASAGEWAVPGTFKFWDVDPATLLGKRRQAFRAGFLGLGSFGWSTLAVVVDASEEEARAAAEALARHLVEAHGAPSLAVALAAAEEEIRSVEELAQHPPQTLVALYRKLRDDGEIAEQFRTFRASDAGRATAMPCSSGAFAIVDDDGATEDGRADGETEAEAFDLAALVARQRDVAAKD